jgi:hypothetical protein
MELKENLKDGNIWLRGLFMLLFAVIFSVARLVLTAVVILQFLIRLISGEVNERLLTFGKILAVYLYEVMLYLTFAQEHRPFPFADWPAETVKSEAETKAAPKKRAARKKAPRAAAKAAPRKPAKKKEEEVDDDPNESGVV